MLVPAAGGLLMLRIKPEQLEHFAGIARERFVAMMTGYLREAFPERVVAMNADALTGWVRKGLDLCERAGATTEPEAAQLIVVLLELGVDAEQKLSWVPPIVAQRGLSPEGKVRAFLRAARESGASIEDLIVYPQFEAPLEDVHELADLPPPDPGG